MVTGGEDRRQLDQPRPGRRWRSGMDWAPWSLGRLGESLAHGMGTSKFMLAQSLLLVGWIAVNALVPAWRWDVYPFILLTLVFSAQAAYAAPLILLAQSRQDDRDQVSVQADRDQATQLKLGTEYVISELAALRVAIDQGLTRDAARDAFSDLRLQLTTPTNGRTRRTR